MRPKGRSARLWADDIDQANPGEYGVGLYGSQKPVLSHPVGVEIVERHVEPQKASKGALGA